MDQTQTDTGNDKGKEPGMSFTKEKQEELYLSQPYLVQLREQAKKTEILEDIKEKLGCKVRRDTFTKSWDTLVTSGVLVDRGNGKFQVPEEFIFQGDMDQLAEMSTEELLDTLRGMEAGSNILEAVRPGNGNGAKASGGTEPSGKTSQHKPSPGGNGVKTKGITFTQKSDGPGSWFNLLILLAYCIQARGMASLEGLLDDIHVRLESKVASGTLNKAITALRKQEIIAVSSSGGESAYSMKRVKFNCSPEIAQVGKLIETLRADAAGQLIITEFQKDKDKKAPPPTETHIIQVDFQLIVEWLGGHVWEGNDLMQELYFDACRYHTLHFKKADRMKGKHVKPGKPAKILSRFQDENDLPLMFQRTYDGKLVASHAASVRGFLDSSMSNIAAINKVVKGGWSSDKFGVGPITADIDEKCLLITRLPVIRDSSKKGRRSESEGAGLKNHEVLKPGITHLTWEMTMPTKNFCTPAELAKWLAHVMRNPFRTMSPARGKQYGAAVVEQVRHKPLLGSDSDWIEV